TGGGGGMTGTTMDRLLQDVRFAVRTLRRNPGFALAAVGVLALGIGASTAIFSAANAFFFRPLPFREPDRLVALYETNPEYSWDEEAAVQAAPANVMDWRERVEAFEDVAMYRDFGLGDVTLATDAEPVVVGGTSVTGNFFDVLGVRPALGRGFRPEETWAGESDVVVISHEPLGDALRRGSGRGRPQARDRERPQPGGRRRDAGGIPLPARRHGAVADLRLGARVPRGNPVPPRPLRSSGRAPRRRGRPRGG